MKISILTDNPQSWIVPFITEFLSTNKEHEFIHIFSASDITQGDILFILSCEKILSSNYLKYNKKNIVIHPSKLPLGKGFSPLAWQILEGKNTIPLTLFEVNEAVDSGDIYFVEYIKLTGYELNEEIKKLQANLTFSMVKKYINQYKFLNPIPQIGTSTFYPKRTKHSSELDIHKNISDQFNLLRIVDNDRYPAYFYVDNKKYILKIYTSE